MHIRVFTNSQGECSSPCEAHCIDKQLSHQPVPAVCGTYTYGLLRSRVKEILYAKGGARKAVGSSIENTAFLLMHLMVM